MLGRYMYANNPPPIDTNGDSQIIWPKQRAVERKKLRTYVYVVYIKCFSFMDPPGMVHPRFRKWSFFYKFSYSYIFFSSSSSSNKNQKEKQKRKGIRKIPQEGFLIFIVVKEKGLTRKICQKLVIFLSFLLSVFYYGIFIVSATAKKKKEENVEEEDEE